MEKSLVKESIGEFFTKFYSLNKGKNVEACLNPKEDRIQIYYKDKGTFDYVELLDENPTVDGLVKSLSE